MKYLLVIALALVVFWWLRNQRRQSSPSRPAASQASSNPALPTEIVACDACQVHLPRAEALAGPRGIYCSQAHRQQAAR